MSLASTVSSVIEVPATHSSGVEWIWPGLDRRDLVLAGFEQPAADRRDVRLVRAGPGHPAAGRS